MSLIPVLGSTLGKIFAPLYELMGSLIAFFYALVPNYAIAIALLTVVVMIVTAPLTVKSTKSMVKMQRLSPELKKIQQKYKGDRVTLNEEMMKLYKEHGVSPAGGCLPMFAQFPVFIILYGVIKGLANTITRGKSGLTATLSDPKGICHQAICALPRYIGTNTKLYRNLVHSPGNIPAFGINLADKVLHHPFLTALPYAALILIAIGLQYFQMRQLNKRNPQAQSNPQMQMMQRYMPLIFAVIYINIAAGVNIYFIVSSLCRIGIQEAIFRSGALDRAVAVEETLPSAGGGSGSAPRRRSMMERLADMQKQALEQKEAQQRAREGKAAGGAKPSDRSDSSPGPVAPRKGPSSNGAPKTTGQPPPKPGGTGSPKANGQGSASTAKNTNGAGTGSPATNGAGANRAETNGVDDKKATHPRAKTKRDRKDR
jgi:YidC/Oxa1 family membrane protein insertase